MSEDKERIAKKLSERVQLAMMFNICKKYLDSENYQVMNYGIGGAISGHLDSEGLSHCLLAVHQY